jgi:hypothetical protein
MHKKALAFTWMHALIIMLLVLVVMLFFVSDISNLIKGTAEKDTCKASVYKNAVGNMKFVDIASDINCPTQNITIKGDDAKKRLAGAMYDCWDKFGEGKLNLFPAVCQSGRFSTVFERTENSWKRDNLSGIPPGLSNTAQQRGYWYSEPGSIE